MSRRAAADRAGTIACRLASMRIFAATLWLVVCLLPSLRGWSADAVPWSADLDAAARRARDEAKLLLVLHFSGDFTKNSADTREAKVYSSLTLADQRVKELIAARFVVTFRQVGQPATIMATLPAKGQPKLQGTENVIAYFVAPDGRVLHFISGFVTPEVFYKEAQWAEDCFQDIGRFPQQEQPLAIRESHLKRVPKDNLQLFSSLRASRWTKDAAPSAANASDIEQILLAARKTREQRLLERFGKNFSPAEAAAVLAAMAAHGEVEADQAHLVLSEVPLIPFAELQQPAWTILTGQRYWQDTSRRKEIAAWLSLAKEKDRPILLVIAREVPIPHSETKEPDPLAWPTKVQSVVELLRQTEVLQLSLDELAALIVDVGLETITAKAAEPPRYIVLRPDGKRQTVVSQKDGFTKLAQGLKAAAELIASGDAAKAKKGPPDETP